MSSMKNHHCAAAAESDTEFLLVLAKAGDGAALGRLLERYRNYMVLLIRLQDRREPREPSGAEDLFQEIGLEARRRIATFRGTSVREFLSWVRRIIGAILANRVLCSLGAGRSDPLLERAMIDDLDGSSRALSLGLTLPPGASGRPAIRRDQAVILADALEKLPEEYREVIILRHLEGIGFPEVARRMGHTEDSAKYLWLRALAGLRHILEELG